MTLGAVWWADGAWRVRSEPLPLLTPESEAQRTDPIPTVEAGQTVAIRAQGTERLTTLDAYAGLADQVHVNGQLVEAVFLPDQRDSTFGAVAVRGWGSQEVQLPLSAPLALLRFAPGCCSRVAGRSGSLMCLLIRTRAQDDDAFGCADARSLHFSRGETRMSGSLQRLEVLLVGVMMVVAGAVVAVLLYVRPPAQQSYASATAVPVSTAAPTTSVAPATPETNRPTNPAPTPTTATPVVQADEAIASIVPASLIQTAWPLLLVASGALGLAFVLARIVRRRRMAYTGQSVAMLLGAADAVTQAANLRVMHTLHAQGALTADLAAAAGLARRWRWPQVPPLRLPKLRLPIVKRPWLVLPRRRLHPAPRLDVLPVSPYTLEMAAPPAPEAVPLESSSVDHATQPETATSAAPKQKRGNSHDAEDLALAVGVRLRTMWASEGLRSTA
jgi:hypothetical protein